MSISILCIVTTACECVIYLVRPVQVECMQMSRRGRVDKCPYILYLVVAGCALTSPQLLTPLYKCTFRLQRLLAVIRLE